MVRQVRAYLLNVNITELMLLFVTTGSDGAAGASVLAQCEHQELMLFVTTGSDGAAGASVLAQCEHHRAYVVVCYDRLRWCGRCERTCSM